MKMNNDFIEIYDNSVPQKLCNELIEWFDLCSDKNFTLHNTDRDYRYAPQLSRSDEVIHIPQSSVFSLSISNEVCDAFWDVLNKCFNEYVKKYNLIHMKLACYTFKIHKVKKGQGYHVWHYEADASINRNRALAWMTYLKVPEKGGETEFLYQSKRIEPVVGKTLIWPAYFTHLHRGNPPLKGEKYYITGWFERE